jgi:hypothetical protein
LIVLAIWTMTNLCASSGKEGRDAPALSREIAVAGLFADELGELPLQSGDLAPLFAGTSSPRQRSAPPRVLGAQASRSSQPPVCSTILNPSPT